MKMVCPTDSSFVLTFHSDITFIDFALEIIRKVAAYQRVRNPVDLLIVSNELLKNAVVHGNRNDSSKTVTYRLVRIDDGRHCVEAEDRGAGFAMPAPTAGHGSTGSNLSSGHGLQIVQSLAESVRVNKRGNRVTALLSTCR